MTKLGHKDATEMGEGEKFLEDFSGVLFCKVEKPEDSIS